MVYTIKNPNKNEWLFKYNELILANEANTQGDKSGLSQFTIIPSAIDPNIAKDDVHNVVWMNRDDSILARLYLYRYNSFFAPALWFAYKSGADTKVVISKKELFQIRKDMVDVRAGKLKYTGGSTEKHRIYLANGLFCAADRMLNDVIYEKITAIDGWACYAPQKNDAINDKSQPASSIQIYEGDTEELKKADVILAVLDGQDLGVASEIGWVASWNETHAKKKMIVGIYTDNRDASKTMTDKKNDDIKEKGLAESQYSYINLYTVGAIKKYGVIVDNIDSAIAHIRMK